MSGWCLRPVPCQAPLTQARARQRLAFTTWGPASSPARQRLQQLALAAGQQAGSSLQQSTAQGELPTQQQHQHKQREQPLISSNVLPFSSSTAGQHVLHTTHKLEEVVTWAGSSPNSAGIAVCSCMGKQRGRPNASNQDAFVVESLDDAATLVGVFDGHGVHGQQVANQLLEAVAAAAPEFTRQVAASPHRERMLWWDYEEEGFEASQLGSSSGGGGGSAACDSASSAGSMSLGEGSLQEERWGCEVSPSSLSGMAASESPEPSALLTLDDAEDCLQALFTRAMEAIQETKCDVSRSGSTAVLALVLKDIVVAGWTGDSRAVVGTAEGGKYTALQLTRDHTLDRQSELARVKAAGGLVVCPSAKQGRAAGPCRVWVPGMPYPGLSMARAFGDSRLSGIVVPTPDFAAFSRSPPGSMSPPSHASSPVPTPQAASASQGGEGGEGMSGCAPSLPAWSQQAQQAQQGPPADVLVVATDGLWSMVSNQEAVDVAVEAGTPEAATQRLVELARQRWEDATSSRLADDITVVVVYL